MNFMESVAWCKEQPGVNVAFFIGGPGNVKFMTYSCGMPWQVDPVSSAGWMMAQYSPPAPWMREKEQIFRPITGDGSWQFQQIAGEWQPFTNWDDFIKFRDRKEKA